MAAIIRESCVVTEGGRSVPKGLVGHSLAEHQLKCTVGVTLYYGGAPFDEYFCCQYFCHCGNQILCRAYFLMIASCRILSRLAVLMCACLTLAADWELNYENEVMILRRFFTLPCVPWITGGVIQKLFLCHSCSAVNGHNFIIGSWPINTLLTHQIRGGSGTLLLLGTSTAVLLE